MKLSPYAKQQLAQMKAAGIVPAPRPKFKIGDQVSDADGTRHGRVDYVGRYDDYLGGYTYKVREPSGTRNTWNETSMVKVKGKSMPAKNAQHLSKAGQKKLAQQDNVTHVQVELDRIAKGSYPTAGTEAHELELFFENDRPLYERRRFFDQNLARKIVAGKYNHAMSVKLWRYLADEAAQKYSKEHGSGHGSSFGIFTTKHRDQLAARLAHDFAVRMSVPGMGDLDPTAREILEKPFKG